MKHILFVVMSIFLSTSIFANDDDGVNGPYYAFYHLQVPNPGDLIDSMNRFWSSDCGKEYTADVAQSGLYTLKFRYSSGNPNGGGPFTLQAQDLIITDSIY